MSVLLAYEKKSGGGSSAAKTVMQESESDDEDPDNVTIPLDNFSKNFNNSSAANNSAMDIDEDDG